MSKQNTKMKKMMAAMSAAGQHSPGATAPPPEPDQDDLDEPVAAPAAAQSGHGNIKKQKGKRSQLAKPGA